MIFSGGVSALLPRSWRGSWAAAWLAFSRCFSAMTSTASKENSTTNGVRKLLRGWDLGRHRQKSRPRSNARWHVSGPKCWRVPDVVIQLTSRPQDGQYFDTLRRFAQDKYHNSQALHPLETLARGPLGFVADMLGPNGPAGLDRYDATLPHKTWELQNAVRQIGLPDYADPIDKAMGIYLHRKQFLTDAIATGIPREEAAAHPDLPDYDGVAQQFARLGGYETFAAAADAYLKENYPWQDAGQ